MDIGILKLIPKKFQIRLEDTPPTIRMLFTPVVLTASLITFLYDLLYMLYRKGDIALLCPY